MHPMPGNKLTSPNILSASRLLMTPFAAYSVIAASWYWALAILWLAIATDLADGYIARKTHSTSNFGGLLDHGADATLVSGFLFALSHVGLVPVWLPILVLLAFLQYVLDSSALAGQTLKASFLGRSNGILYFVVTGLVIMQQAFEYYLLSNQAIIYLSYCMIISTLISMLDRLLSLMKVR